MTLSEEGEAKTEQSDHITRGIGSLTIQNVATSALGFVFLAILLRFLPNIDYGVYSAMAVSIGIASVIAPTGLQYAAAKFLSDGNGTGELRARARKIILLSLATSVLASVLFAAFARDLSIYFTRSAAWTYDFIIGAIWLFSSSFSSVVQGCVQGLKRYTSLAGMLSVARVLMVALTIVGLELTHNLFVSYYAWIVYFAVVILWSFWILFTALPKSSVSGITNSGSLTYRDLLKYALPLGLAGIFFILSTEVDIVVVGGNMNPSALGIYNTVVTISNVLNFVLVTPLATALLPEASFRVRDHKEISNGMRLAIRFVFLTVLPASLLMAAVAPQLLQLFSGGLRYEAGSVPLQIIAIFYLFFGIQYVVYSILQANGSTLQVFLITAATAATIFVISEILVPHFGLLGASIARSLSVVVGVSIAAFFARSFLQKLDESIFYVKALVSSLIPFLAVWSLTNFVSSKAWTIAPYTLVGAMGLGACLYILRVLNEEDRRFILSVLPSSIRRRALLLMSN